MKVDVFYEDVLRGDFKRIRERSPKFHEFVLCCAQKDGRQDVVDRLLAENICNGDVALTLVDYLMLPLFPIVMAMLIYLCFYK